MKTAMTIIFSTGALLASQVALATPEELLQKGGCTACHSVSKKILGPAFKDVAAKYKGQDVTEKLIQKVKQGGSGAWGPMPMPPNAGKLTDDEFKTVVGWVLAQ